MYFPLVKKVKKPLVFSIGKTIEVLSIGKTVEVLSICKTIEVLCICKTIYVITIGKNLFSVWQIVIVFIVDKIAYARTIGKKGV